jgi:GNAT superfamily N-acetyltransferase
MSEFTIRRARPGDEETIYNLLREFAEFEFRLDEYMMTPEIVRRDVFGPAPKLFVALAFRDDAAAGLANWYWTYSSFAAKRGMFIEDIFVLPKFRKKGLGKLFLSYLAKESEREGAQRMDWMVLDWNEKAMLFYKNLGSRMVAEWITFRLEGDAMKKLAQ